MKKWAWRILPPLTIVFILSGLALTLKPRLEAWILSQVHPFSVAKLPVLIEAKEFHLELLLPKAEFTEIRIQTKPGLLKDPLSIKIAKVTAKLDILSLLAGKLALSGVLIDGADLDIELDSYLNPTSSNEPINWKSFFDLLKQIPIYRLAFQGARTKISSKKLNMKAELLNLDLLVANEKSRVDLRADLQDANLVWGELASPLRLQTDITLSPQGLDVHEIRLLGLGSVIRAEASLSKISHLLIAPEGNIQFDIKAALPQLAHLAQRVQSFPNLNGSIEMSGQIDLKNGVPKSGGFRFFAKDLSIQKTLIGDIQTEAHITSDKIAFKKIALTHSAGNLDLSDTLIRLRKETNPSAHLSIESTIETEALDLHELLAQINVGDIPLELFITAKAKCSGPLWPNLQIQCQSNVEGDQLEVRTDDGIENTIVQVPHISAQGRVYIDLEKVVYEATLQEQEEFGRSSGVIRYDEGFEIDFSTPKLSTNKIKRLAGLKLNGSTRINGKTVGNSESARFQMMLETQNFYLEDFLLGQAKTLLSYEKGLLTFSNIQGEQGATSYSGAVTVDLSKSMIDVTAKSDRLDLVDVTHIIEKNIPIPFSLSGTGVGEVRLQGPFAVNKLSYQAQVQLSKVQAVGETFDKAYVEVKSTDGEFEFEKAYVSKGQHQIQITGNGHPNGQIDFTVVGQALPLENSDNLSTLGTSLSGRADFVTKIQGQIRQPEYHIQASLYDIFIEEQELAPTQANVHIKKDTISGSAKLVGGALTTNFQIPFAEAIHNGENFFFKAEAQNWKYTDLFALIGAGSLISEYQSALTGKIDLKSDSGGLWRATGSGVIEKLSLKRGALSLENQKSIHLLAQNGNFSLQDFNLSGPDADIKIQSDQVTRDQLSGTVQAKINVRLLQIFFPFMDELSGNAEARIDLSGKILKPELLGLAKANGVFVKLKGFPHPVEKIKTQVDFSQSKINISDIQAELAGGSISGNGQIEINGPKDLPTQIQLNINKVNLNVPDRIRTTGSGQLNLTGNWFPFLLAGEYRVSGGLVDKEFTDSQTQNLIRQSSYLPKIILQKAFEPIILDIKVKLENPLAIKNSLVEGSVTGQIQVKGPPENPILFGTLNTERGTKILFRDKIFDVNVANLKFNNPTEINPEVYATARTRVNEYDINLLVQGTAKDPLLRTSSTPPLSEPDIVSLLALGVTSSDLDKRLQKTNQEQSGQYQVGTALIQQFEPVKKLQKAAGIQVQYSSSYDNTRNLEVRKFTISKQLSPKTKISVAFPPDKQPNEYRLQYSLTPNVSAIGTLEQKNRSEDQILQQNQNEIENVLGLDLEYRKEFR